MRIIERFRAMFRAFVVGPSVVSPMDERWPKEHDDPVEDYGNYLKTSNGIYTCSWLRARNLSQVEPQLLRMNGEKPTPITSGPIVELLNKVNPFWTFDRLLEMIELSLCLWGKAFIVMERGDSGTMPPRELWWADPRRMRVVPSANGYIAGYQLEMKDSADVIPFKPDEVIYLRYPNPLNEFDGLSPVSASRVSADFATDAMRANRKLFVNGLIGGGFIFPVEGRIYDDDTFTRLEDKLERRFSGADKAYRWAVFKREFKVENVNLSPKDAEFVTGLKVSLEDIARAYLVPLDLVGGQRTFENFDAAMKALWTNCLSPEACFIGDEFTEQLLPAFGNTTDKIVLSTEYIAVLQEFMQEKWQRKREQIDRGIITINECREEEGMEPVAWGDVWWRPVNLVATDSADVVEPMPAEEPPPSQQGQEAYRRRTLAATNGHAVELNSQEHERIWLNWWRRAERHEELIKQRTTTLLKRQRASVQERLKQNAKNASEIPFRRNEWVKKFRETLRPIYRTVLQEAGQEALSDIGSITKFIVDNPTTTRFLNQRVRLVADSVNDTTYAALKASLAEGIASQETAKQLAARVDDVFQVRLNAVEGVIARTETTVLTNAGTLHAWQTSGEVRQKQWVATFQNTRESHADAHGQVVDVDDDFEIGEGSGPAPGDIDVDAENINCQCIMQPIIGVTL